MLIAVSGKDYLAFESFEIMFSEGLSVITGESGSGKTLLLRAIQALVGSLPSISPPGGYVEGVFSLKEKQQALLKSQGYNTGREVVVSVDFSGQRVIFRVDGRLSSKQFVQNLLTDTLEVHSQHSTVRLLDPTTHHVIVDNAISADRRLLEEYSDLFREYSNICRRLSSLSFDEQTADREEEVLQFQLDEIDRAKLDPKSDSEIEQAYMRLRDSEMLMEAFEKLISILRTEDTSAYARLSEGIEIMQSLDRFGYHDESAKLIEALNALQQSCQNLEQGMTSLDYDEESVQIVEARMNLIQDLKRKYGGSLESVLKHRDSIVRSLSRIRGDREEIERLSKKRRDALESLWRVGKDIDALREKQSKELVKSVKQHLKDLKMDETDLRFVLIPEEVPKLHGTSRVILEIKTHDSSPYIEIGKVASGGELSRLLIAIECALKDFLPVSTVVFDEIDVGVGQRMGDIMAEKLKELSRGVQTIVITHLPQVAQIADAHFAVSRSTGNRDFVSTVSRLEGKPRMREIEEMSGKRLLVSGEDKSG